MTPAGPAVCPHTAKSAHKSAGRAKNGANKRAAKRMSAAKITKINTRLYQNDRFFSSLLG
jgi:hypothetical protein